MTNVNRRMFLGAAGAVVAGQTLTRASAASDTLSIGIVGVGNRGSYLLQNLLQIPGVSVRAICDIDRPRLAKAQQVVASSGQAMPSGTAEWKALNDMKELDAIVSALPCDLHAAHYLDVIAAGKDLYGEKPMCLTRKDLDAVVAATKKSKQVVQIGHQRRADPRFIEPMKEIHEGEIGDLVEGRIHWSNSWGPLLGWFGKKERSGDWIVEQAVHNWDVMNWANKGLPVKAMGMGRDDLFRDLQSDRNVHDYYAGVVQYPNGVIVNIIHSWVAPTKLNEEYTRLIGTRGGVDFNSGVFSFRPDLKKPDRVGHSEKGEVNNTLLALKAFVETVRKRTTPVCTVEHGRDAVLACLLMRTAVETGNVATQGNLGG